MTRCGDATPLLVSKSEIQYRFCNTTKLPEHSREARIYLFSSNLWRRQSALALLTHAGIHPHPIGLVVRILPIPQKCLYFIVLSNYRHAVQILRKDPLPAPALYGKLRNALPDMRPTKGPPRMPSARQGHLHGLLRNETDDRNPVPTRLPLPLFGA